MRESRPYPRLEKCYIVGTDLHCFRTNEPAEIIGIFMGEPDKKSKPRLVYKVLYSDGVEDFIPVSEVGGFYEIITFVDIINGKIPKVK